MISLFLILCGSILASFVACYGERRRLGLSQRGRSVCRTCGQVIAPLYLIPLFGFLLCRGRCHHCHAPIPRHLPLLELLGACSGLLLTRAPQPIGHLLLLLVIGSLLLLLALNDAMTQTIYDKDLLVLTVVMTIDSFLFGNHNWLLQISGAFLVALPLFCIMRWQPQGLGSGDVLFMAISGFYLGAFHIANAFLIGICLALCYSLFLLWRKQANGQTAIALIPFLASGVWGVILTL